MAATIYDLKKMKAFLIENDLPLPPKNLLVSDFEAWARSFGYNEPNVGDDPEFKDVFTNENYNFVTYLSVAIVLTVVVLLSYIFIHLS